MDCQGIGDVVCSLPLLSAICAWANGRFPVYALFKSSSQFDLVRGEGLNICSLFVEHSHRGIGGLVSLGAKLRGKVDLIVAIPEISETKLLALKYMLGARYLVSEARPAYRSWISTAVPLDWTQSFLDAQKDIAKALDIQAQLAPPKITLTAGEVAWADFVVGAAGIRPGGRLLGIHCAAAVPQKAWPTASFGRRRPPFGRGNPRPLGRQFRGIIRTTTSR